MERTYRIHIASEMTGVSEGLIRAWERRYGVLKPRRTASGYRAYTQGDIEVLKRLKKLTEEGVSIAEAVGLLPQIKQEAKDHLEAQESPRIAPAAEQYGRWRQEVLVAAERLDQQVIERVLDEAMASLPPVAFFDDVLMPLQREVGERWHAGQMTIAEEHLVTQAARQRVLTLLHQAPKRARAHVVCACFPHEDHELGLMGVALRFRHAGWRVTFLGARTPPEHLARVARMLSPELIALSSVGEPDEAAFRKTLQQIMTELPAGSKVLVGGASGLQHREAVVELGAQCVATAEEWEKLLA